MTDKSKVQGEGDYEAARRYDKAQEDFAKTGKADAKAREAEEALDGPEGPSLEEARKKTGEGKTR